MKNKTGHLVRVARANTGASPKSYFHTDELAFITEDHPCDDECVKIAQGDRWTWMHKDDLAPAQIGDEQRLPLPIAQVLAADAVALLTPACERIEIAGSIRRGKYSVGDIEVVCVPKTAVIQDLFGDAGLGASALDALCAQLLDSQALEYRLDTQGRRAWGSKYKRALLCTRGVAFALDIFVVLPPAQWGVIDTIRTGPGDFSKALVTDRQHGGAKPSYMKVKDGALYGSDGKVIPTPEEVDFFAALGLRYIEPAQRTVERLEAEVKAAMAAEIQRRGTV